MDRRIPFYRFFLKIALSLPLAGCYKNHLYVQQEWIDENYLASTRIPGAPDPRRQHPPLGQRLLLSWDFPKSLFEKELALHITIRFWNNEETTLVQPVERKRSYADFFFPFADKNCRILTYCVRVVSKDGELIETWKHQFWTELIEIGTEKSRACDSRRSSSVSSHPKQGSVTETP